MTDYTEVFEDDDTITLRWANERGEHTWKVTYEERAKLAEGESFTPQYMLETLPLKLAQADAKARADEARGQAAEIHDAMQRLAPWNAERRA